MKVSEKCPECGHGEAYFQEKQVRRIVCRTAVNADGHIQMRSADEGSTILYTVRLFPLFQHKACYCWFADVLSDQCVDCKHGWRVNN